jgi:predicted metalloprotease with PDZ domain
VSAVEANSPAETSGLEVGDVIMSINGLEVLESSHGDVVRIASCVDLLELELARTMDIISEHGEPGWDRVLKEGIMEKFNGLELEDERGRGKWVRR